ncbi:MAG: ATPase, T2SS/T4P/T4SS family [Candidatus Limnocylindrales bacterium]
MRPDRIIVGECRSGEALDMLQAMNTGHDGSMSTGHANSPRDMLSRLETMVLMAGVDLPAAGHPRADRLCRRPDRPAEPAQGRHPQASSTSPRSRAWRATSSSCRTSSSSSRPGVIEGKIQGRLKPTGIRPKFVEKFEVHGHPPAARPLRLQLLTGKEHHRL